MIPNLSVLWVIFFVLLLTVILDRLLFRPLLRTIAQREAAIRPARELAERSANEARAATAEFEQRTSVARAEIYKQMDEMRRAAMAERADILAATRAEAEAGSRRPRRFRLRRGGAEASHRRRRRARSGGSGADSRTAGFLTISAFPRVP